MFSCRLKNYVLNGKGIGLKVVFLFMLITAFMAAFGLYGLFDAAFQSPSNQAFIDTLPVIKIENGKIVEPIYSRETLTIPSANGNTRIVLDTAKDDVTAIAWDETVYITATSIYFRQGNKIDVIKFPESLSKVITHEVVRSYIQQVIIFASSALSLLIFVAGLIGFILLFLVLSALGPVFNKNLTADAWGRISAAPWSLMFIFYIFSIYKWSWHIGYLFLIPLLVSLVIGVRLRNAAEEVCLEEENRHLFLEAAKSIPFMTIETAAQEVPDQESESEAAAPKTVRAKKTDTVKTVRVKSDKKATLTAKKTNKKTTGTASKTKKK